MWMKIIWLDMWYSRQIEQLQFYYLIIILDRTNYIAWLYSKTEQAATGWTLRSAALLAAAARVMLVWREFSIYRLKHFSIKVSGDWPNFG